MAYVRGLLAAAGAAMLLVLVAATSAPAAAPCPGADDPLPTTHDDAVARLPAIRATLACLVNGERTARGLRALRVDTRLAEVAQARANDLVDARYFSHSAPHGSTDPVHELAAYGYRFALAGEDLVRGFDTPAHSVRAWLTTWWHCSVLLNRGFTQQGLGVAFGPPLLPEDGRGLVMFGALIAGRPAGVKRPRGSSSARLGCPYWRVTPTETGWIWELLSRAQSAQVRAATR